MKAGIISLENHDNETKRERLSRVKNIITENAGADLYLLPELWNVGFFAFNNYADAAETIDGETISLLSDIAHANNAYIFTGSIAEKRNGKLYNTAVLLDRRGEIAGRYSKAHLFGSEKEYMTAGNEYSVCDTEFGKVGFSICYDLRFPEQYREMIDMGAEIFLNCSAWPKSRIEHWNVLNRARAIENQALWLSCCSRGNDNGTEYAGVSYAIAPDGRLLLEAKSEFKAVEIDISEIKKCRAEFPALADRI